MDEEQQHQKRPTYKQPGKRRVGSHSCPMTATRYWMEDGKHIFVSEEFGSEGVGASLEEAIQSLGDSMKGYWQHLAQLSDDEIAENELIQLEMLDRRYTSLREESESA